MGSRKRLPKKWLDFIPPTASYTKAAKLVLDARAQAVLHFMPLAIKKTSQQKQRDVEHVHQLRVATRRARAAIATLKGVLPKQRAKRCAKLLGQVRKGSGGPRDLDVMMLRFEKRREEIGTAGISAVEIESHARLFAALRARRRVAQARMQQAMLRCNTRRVAKELSKLTSKIRWRGEGEPPDWQTAAKSRLQMVAARFFIAGRPWMNSAAQRSQIDSIHQLRIDGKRLRYTMEITASGLGPGLRQLYPFIEQTQEILGDVNDHAVAQQFYLQWSNHLLDPELKAPIDAMIEYESAMIDAALTKFSSWWTADRVVSTLKDWEVLLGQRMDRPEPRKVESPLKKVVVRKKPKKKGA